MSVNAVLNQDMKMFRNQDQLGFSLIPLDGKKPIEKNWQQWCQAKRDFRKVDFVGKNAGVCCGPASGVLVLDIDEPKAFEALLTGNGWSIPDTYSVLTGSGKPHYYFKYPENGREYRNKGFKHPIYKKLTVFDIRGDGGQVVAAGSIHPDTGGQYTIHQDGPVAEMPKWLERYVDEGKLNTDVLLNKPLLFPEAEEFIKSLQLSSKAQKLILEGKPKGERSEAVWSVLLALIRAGTDIQAIWFIFDHYPIGQKYREKGSSKTAWLQDEIDRASENVRTLGGTVRPDFQDREPYPEIIDELNSKHAVVTAGGKTLVLNEVIDPVFGKQGITFSSIADFKNRYANRRVSDPDHRGQDVNIATYWFRSAGRRQYQGIVFSPEGDVPGYYNLWKGFGVEPIQGDWSLMEVHIREVICSGDPEAYEYLFAWMAQLVQEPGGWRPGIAVVLRGKQETGKGVFVNTLGKIIGNHYLHLTNQRQLTGKFNNHLKDALLVFADEAFWAGAKNEEGVLKALITEDQFMVEPKGKDVFAVKNHLRLIVASNNKWVVPAGDNDRRFFVLDVSDIHMQDKEGWFVPIMEQMNSGGREAMLYDLRNYDLTGVELNKFPHTEARLEQILHSMSTLDKFWLDRLQDADDEQWETEVGIGALYDQYHEYSQKMGDRYPLSNAQFGKELRAICPELRKLRKAKYKGHPRKPHYVLPDLGSCRRSFAEYIGQEVNWG